MSVSAKGLDMLIQYIDCNPQSVSITNTDVTGIDQETR